MSGAEKPAFRLPNGLRIAKAPHYLPVFGWETTTKKQLPDIVHEPAQKDGRDELRREVSLPSDFSGKSGHLEAVVAQFFGRKARVVLASELREN
jgi:hypothetical protein